MDIIITTIKFWVFFWLCLAFTAFFLLVLLPERYDGGKETFAQRYSIVIILLLSFLFSFMVALL